MLFAMIEYQEAPSGKKVAIVTGANTGIGLATAIALSGKRYHVIVACRSTEKSHATAKLIKEKTGAYVDTLELDLSDLDSVAGAAAAFRSRRLALHLLVNNAGVARLRGISRSGFENTFAVNHLGTFLFTNLLVPALSAASKSRVVTVSSEAHYYARALPWDKLRSPTSYSGLQEYAVSKLANVLFSAELARRTRLATYALHPGRVATDVWRNAPGPVQWVAQKVMLTPEEGARTTLHCCTSPELEDHRGRYYDECKERAPSKLAQDEDLARELWDRSLEWTQFGSRY